MPVYLRDIGVVADAADAPTGYALVNGRRAVYILATKRADASTLSVIHEIRQARFPTCRRCCPTTSRSRFEFDQSPYVTRAVTGVLTEGTLGAILVGLMVLVFLRDWRSALVVVLNIPLALMASVMALWICGYTINVMTLGGLALAIGVLVDEATVEIENIHAQMRQTHFDRLRGAAGQCPHGRAAAAGDALHPGRVRAGVFHGRGRTRSVSRRWRWPSASR